MDFEACYNLLQDDLFKMHVVFLSEIISKINSINARFQARNLSTHEIKQLITLCFTSIAELIIKPSEFSYNPLQIINQDLDQITTREKLLMKERERL